MRSIKLCIRPYQYHPRGGTESIGYLIEEGDGCCCSQQNSEVESHHDNDSDDFRRKISNNRHSVTEDQDGAIRKERLWRKHFKMGPVADREFNKKRLMRATMESTDKRAAPPKNNKGPTNVSNQLMKKQQEKHLRQQEEKKKPINRIWVASFSSSSGSVFVGKQKAIL